MKKTALKRKPFKRKAKKLHDWQQMIDEVAEREGCRCQMCGEKLRMITPANIHHFLARSLGGSDESTNLLLLCSIFQGENCHSWVHNNPREAKARGYLAPAGYKENA